MVEVVCCGNGKCGMLPSALLEACNLCSSRGFGSVLQLILCASYTYCTTSIVSNTAATHGVSDPPFRPTRHTKHLSTR
ncbi:hypothetical protein PC118_g14673 [Phytophthora cactorum]|uniref:Uncharacterized protein n=1 Tax=Phytophthora cactorum TaxID=29920 RepID=A0A8T1CH89_9STRA|nr:hypothetical protein PC111_g13543 [Phytophthora cactorum]KAG2852735.1 hypothetical protein PC113_g14765 [Phytophthora cactorum]KAG2894309.1 hypothetical protein PC114_g15958 [Phytophthora cactorum]KAG2907236.1 hypothetical protein PC115_g14023 [Phytophthora cactorum]KAG2921301.1 hypothetical protein PC117_g16279 [Phytophthora cactorum]